MDLYGSLYSTTSTNTMTTSSKTTTGERVTTSNMIEKSKANSIPVETTILPATANTSHTTARETITASTTKMEKTTSIPIEKEKEMTTSVTGWPIKIKLQRNSNTKGCVKIRHTDRSGLQLSQVLTKNYSNAPRVPMGIWGLG